MFANVKTNFLHYLPTLLNFTYIFILQPFFHLVKNSWKWMGNVI